MRAACGATGPRLALEWMRREDDDVPCHRPMVTTDRVVAVRKRSLDSWIGVEESEGVDAARPLDLRELFARPWEGDAVIVRPWYLRLIPAPSGFHFRSEIANQQGDQWDVVDTTTFPDGTVQRRTMHAEQTGEALIELTADDMPGGARVHVRRDGFDFSPYVVRTPFLGRLRVPLRCHDTADLHDDGTLIDTIELRCLGVRVATITMRLRRQ